MATVTMVLCQLRWLRTCTYIDKTQAPHLLLSKDSTYQEMNTRSHISLKSLGGFWVVLDERLRTGSAAGAPISFDCEFDCECAADDSTSRFHSDSLLDISC